MGNDISIEQLEFMRNQRYFWLCENSIDHPWYNKVRDEYEGFNKIIIEYYNAKAERKTKILTAIISGGMGLIGIGTSIVISNSSLGPKFDNSMKGLSGKIVGKNF